MQDMDFLSHIRALADARGMTLVQLEKRSGVSRKTIYAAADRARARGAADINDSTARKLAQALSVSVHEVRGEDPLDTMRLAREAARLLVKLDAADPDEAWLIMRDVSSSAVRVEEFYELGRLELERLRELNRVTPSLENRVGDTKLGKKRAKTREVVRARKHRDRK